MKRQRSLLAPLSLILAASLVAAACAKADRAGPAARGESSSASKTVSHAKGKIGFTRARKSDDGVARRKIIRRGELHVTVKQYDKTRATLMALLRRAGGYVARSQVRHSLGKVSYATLVLRIPATGFGDVVARIRTLGMLTHESIRAEDVTARYTDLVARLRTKRKLEARLLELVAKKSNRIAELLSVERELARVRGEIERYEGQKRMLDKLVSLATLTLRLSVSRDFVPPRAPTLAERASSALSRSVATLADVGQGTLLAAVALLPWLLPIGGVAGAGALLVRRRRRRRRAEDDRKREANPNLDNDTGIDDPVG